jgi:hypothetical protein
MITVELGHQSSLPPSQLVLKSVKEFQQDSVGKLIHADGLSAKLAIDFL